MRHYAYTAMDATGKLARGRLAANNAFELEHNLHRLGLDLIAFRLTTARKLPFRNISRHDQALFCFEMEQLLHASVPLLQAFDELQFATENALLRLTIGQLKLAIEGGASLSQALFQHQHCLPGLLVPLIHIGEVTGCLPEVFGHLAATLSWHDEMSKKLHHALLYPTLVLATVFACAVFLLVYLVPQMAAFFKSSGQPLPVHTQVLLTASEHFARHGWHWLLGIMASVASAAWIVARFPAARNYWDRFILRLPVIGALLQKSLMARFARYLALMYQTGIPLLDALKHCRDAVGNLEIASRLDLAIGDIQSGTTMSNSLQKIGIFPPLVVRMLHIGETTGGLDTALNRVSEYYDRDIRHTTETLLRLLEPVLTLLLGGLMGLMMFSILGPIYDAISEIRL
jgi:type IV pilus assembly protein PilC